MKKSLSSKVLEITLYILLGVSAIVTISIPFVSHWFVGILYSPFYWLEHTKLLIAFLMLLGICGIWVFAELLGMVRTISKNPFIPRNVKALKRTGFAALAAALLFFAKCILLYSFTTLLCGIALIVAVLFCFTLSDLFKQAVHFKQENDFTI